MSDFIETELALMVQPEPLETGVTSLIAHPKNLDTFLTTELLKVQRSVWSHTDIEKDLIVDRGNIINIKEVQHYLRAVVSFFAVSDGIIESVINSLNSRITHRGVQIWLNWQNAVESVHQLTYGFLYDAYANNPGIYPRIDINDVEFIPVIAKQIQWVRKYIGGHGRPHGPDIQDIGGHELRSTPLAVHIFVQLSIETVFFQTEFAGIFEIDSYFGGKFPALQKSNELIGRDEGGHAIVFAYIYNNYIVNRLSKKLAHQIMRDAVENKSEYIRHELQTPLPGGLNADIMIRYAQFIADKVLGMVQYEPLFGVSVNPIAETRKQSIDSASVDFFTQTPTMYGSVKKNLDDISFD